MPPVIPPVIDSALEPALGTCESGQVLLRVMGPEKVELVSVFPPTVNAPVSLAATTVIGLATVKAPPIKTLALRVPEPRRG